MKTSEKTFKAYWAIFWGVLFMIPEAMAATDGLKGGTMSEWFWDVFAIRIPDPKWAFLRRFILGSLLWSVALHFLFMTPAILIGIFAVGAVGCVYYHHRYE